MNSFSRSFAYFAGILLLCGSIASAQWKQQTVNTTAGFRGLSVVSDKVVWASGTGGTVIRTTDTGETWNVMTVPGAEKLDFRDIEAFDANTAYILSIGNGDSSRIYKTTDGGKTWNLQFKNSNEKAFFDSIACWDMNNCLAISDPVDGKYVLINTGDGGSTWKPVDTSKMPAAKEGEAAFAASGTCLITQGKTGAFLATGGADARVFRSTDRGRTWAVATTPIVKGTPASGIFSIAMLDAKNGVIVGGNYQKPTEVNNSLAFTTDGGKTWVPGKKHLNGFRSGVTYITRKMIMAVGTSGTDYTSYADLKWVNTGKEDLNTVQTLISGKYGYVWAVGPKGFVGVFFIGNINQDPFASL